MKTKLLIIFGLIIMAFSSCDLNSESNYKPTIQYYTPALSGKTPLGLYLTDAADVVRMDTIHVGDTVSFYMVFDSYANNLVTLSIAQSADSVTKLILPPVSQLDSVFGPTSNYNSGTFNLRTKSSSLFFPIKYVALKATNDAKIKFTIVSDATVEYNLTTLTFKTPIKPAVAATE